MRKEHLEGHLLMGRQAPWSCGQEHQRPAKTKLEGEAARRLEDWELGAPVTSSQSGYWRLRGGGQARELPAELSSAKLQGAAVR